MNSPPLFNLDALSSDSLSASLEEEPEDGLRGMLQAAPSVVISMLLHVLIIVGLGLITFAEPQKIVNVLSVSSTVDDGPEIEEFTIEAIDPGEVLEEMEEFAEAVELTEPVEFTETVSVDVPMEVAAMPIEMSDLAGVMAPAAAQLQTLASTNSQLDSRSVDMKKQMLREYGGNKSSEAAVTEALKWFALHQAPNGGWTFAHNLICGGKCGNACDAKRAGAVNAATAMALLPYMGAGQTHFAGDFKDNVRRGLLFLINNGQPGRQAGLPVLNFTEPGGNMYSHGLATIALSEAYAMTQDPALAGPTQAALNFIITAQCADGGWRYQPREARGGDTSVFGWQLMALKSGYMGHLIVPPQTIQGSVLFLNKVQSKDGAWYGYDRPTPKERPTTTAVGLLCRMYLGWDKDNPAMIEGVKTIAKRGPSKSDLYYNYYAAQLMRQFGGPDWEKFNVELRDYLVSQQGESGGEKGSWFIKGGSHGQEETGRLLCTSFCTMILEVYYRHMPLYADSGEEDDFPL